MGCPSTIERDRYAGDVVGRRTAEEDRESADLFDSRELARGLFFNQQVMLCLLDGDLIALRARLQSALPADVRVLTLEEFMAKERDFWDKVAPVGTVFYIGVVMGFIVGCAICYQVLFSDISERIGEFATLKAMGYSNLRLLRVVVMQGIYLALLGYLAGLAVSLLLFRWVHEATGLPLDLSRNDPLAILGLSLIMCVLSGAYAARKLLSVDPAQLFA